MTVTIPDTAALVTRTTIHRRRTGGVPSHTECMVVLVEIMAVGRRLYVMPDRVLVHMGVSRFDPQNLNRLRRNLCPGRICPGRVPNGKAALPGRVAVPRRRAPYAGESNRARSAGGWGQADPVARRHGRALEDVRRFAVVDDDARAVGVARQGDVLRQQAMVVHELELEV